MKWVSVGLKLLPFIVESINWVEKFIMRRGPEKQDAAVKMTLSMLGIAEEAMAKDIANDDDVEKATRHVIDAVVALQNLIASKILFHLSNFEYLYSLDCLSRMNTNAHFQYSYSIVYQKNHPNRCFFFICWDRGWSSDVLEKSRWRFIAS